LEKAQESLIDKLENQIVDQQEIIQTQGNIIRAYEQKYEKEGK
jgi:uncharacterized coiled-coil protein SlyX